MYKLLLLLILSSTILIGCTTYKLNITENICEAIYYSTLNSSFFVEYNYASSTCEVSQDPYNYAYDLYCETKYQRQSVFFTITLRIQKHPEYDIDIRDLVEGSACKIRRLI
jgi:hypothetical protein